MRTRPPEPHGTKRMKEYLYIDLYGAKLCPRSLMVRSGLDLSGLSYRYRETSLFEPTLPSGSIYGELPLLSVGWSHNKESLIEDYRGILLFLDEKLPGKELFPSNIPSKRKVFDYLEALDTEILPFLFFPILVEQRRQKIESMRFPVSSLKKVWSVITGAPVLPLPYPMPFTAFDDDLFFQALGKLQALQESEALAFPLIARIISNALSALSENHSTAARLADGSSLQTGIGELPVSRDYGT